MSGAVRRPGLRVLRALVCGVLLATAALAAPAPRAVAEPERSTTQLTALLDRLQELYLQAEEATESYDEAKSQLKEQSGTAKRLDKQLAEERIALAEAKSQAGAIARQQYKDGSVEPYLNLMLSDTPEDLFSQSHILQRAAGTQAEVVERLKTGETRISTLNRAAQHSLDSSQNLAKQQREAKQKVEDKLANVEKIVAGLTGTELRELQRLEEAGIAKAQQLFLGSNQLSSTDLAPSQAGAQAISFAYGQLGKPYVWGAEGPKSYDCSGLTSKAWADAGVTIPRTSEQQWKQLTRIPLSLLRPGDLVVYYEGASHVAIYIGNGKVIQAPRPGAVVKISPIAGNPILGAVRPDPDAGSMDEYVTPQAPDSATDPTPIGDTSS
jgi:cell wall-associated NlpC family hydrolase